MSRTIFDELRNDLKKIEENGLFKKERVIKTPQGAEIGVATGETILNFCANNYLGLANDPAVIDAAHRTLDTYGYGMSSVRFICGTQSIHKELEKKVSAFLETDDTILYAACFDANGGVFEPFMNRESAIITDALNHASIIDGIRLTKAHRFIFKHADMADLELKLKESQTCKYRMIVTDGVFSMDGDIAKLDKIYALSKQYDALVLVDDSHATGVVGKTGKGTPEMYGLSGKIDLITTTFGKALGGASGGCVTGKQEMIDYLRQRSRPYLFSNTLAPVVAGASVAVIDMLQNDPSILKGLNDNTAYFRSRMENAGFDLKKGIHPIIPIMLHDDRLAITMADKLLDEGIYVIGFTYPVVPVGQARIRVQISAAHSTEQLERAVDAFVRVGKELNVIS